MIYCSECFDKHGCTRILSMIPQSKCKDCGRKCMGVTKPNYQKRTKVKNNSTTKTQLQPLYDRVIIRRDKTPSQAPGSVIVIPEGALEKMNQGTVIAVGDGQLMDDGTIRPLQTKQGDHILFGKYNGFEVTFDGEDLIVMKENEIFAIIKD